MAAAVARRLQTMMPGASTAATAAARRPQTMVPGASTAAAAAVARLRQTMVPGDSTAAAVAARRLQTMVPGASTATGSHSLMSQGLLRMPHKEIRTVFGLPRPTYNRLQQGSMCASSSSAKDGLIDHRNMEDLTQNFGAGDSIEVVHGASKEKKRQMKTAEKLSNLESRIE